MTVDDSGTEIPPPICGLTVPNFPDIEHQLTHRPLNVTQALHLVALQG